MRKRFITVLVVFCITVVAAYGHPHLFIDAWFELDMDESGMRGFWVEWSFDQYFTGSIMMDYDRDGDRRFSAAETRDVEANAFSNLINYNYFTFIVEDGQHRGVTEVTDFSVRFDHGALVYRFYVPYRRSADHLRPFTFACYDPSFFSAVSYDDRQPVRLSDNRRWSLNVEQRENPSVQIEYMANDTRATTVTIDEVVVTVERN